MDKNIKISEETHRQLKMLSADIGKNISVLANEAIDEFIKNNALQYVTKKTTEKKKKI